MAQYPPLQNPPAQNPPAAPTQQPGRLPWLGWLCLVPAVAVGVWQLLIPAVQTLIGSFYRSRPGRGSGGEFVGTAGYLALDDLGVTLLRGLLFGVPAFLVVALLGVAVGTMAARARTPLRIGTRVALGLLLVVYAPIGIALATRTSGSRPTGALSLVVLLVVIVLPLGFAIAAAVAMAGARSLVALAVAGLVGLVTTFALGLQLLGIPLAATGGGPGRTTQTPGLLIYQEGFARFAFERALAMSTILLVVLGLLGVLVTLLLLVAPLRVELRPASGGGSVGLGVAALGVTALVGVVFAVLAISWIAGLFVLDTRGVGAAQAFRITLNTWGPPAVTVLVQLLVGGAAAYGIAVLRPLGDKSSWLLLAFAPGLFVGLVPLLGAHFLSMMGAGRLNGGFAGAIPPALLSVPILYVFTFVFAGLRRAWLADPQQRRPAVVAGLSVVVLCGLVSYVLLAQSIVWNLLVAARLEDANGPAALLRVAATYAGGRGGELPQQLATPAPILFVLGLIAAAAMVGLDRLTLTKQQDSLAVRE